MNDKVWLKKLALNMVLLVAFLLGVSYTLHDGFKNDTLQNKQYLLEKYSPKVIFAGDSRAERQLNNDTARKVLKLNQGEVINIAMSSGDPLMVNSLIDQFPEKFKDSTVILSISANQMNDNAKKLGYFTYSMIAKLDYINQLKTFLPENGDNLFQYYLHVLGLANTNPKVNEFEKTLGFNGISGQLQIHRMSMNSLRNNPWYQNYGDGGIKYTLIYRALKEIKTKVKHLYVYTAPFAPVYIDAIKDSALLKYEISFKEKVQTACEENGIVFKNYMRVSELNNEHFYDAAHVNIEGSKVFTKRIIKDFLNETI